MAFMVEIYSVDEEAPIELADGIGHLVAAAQAPAPAEAPGSLDLDLASLGGHLWEVVVAFGSVKATLEAVDILLGILRRRRASGVETEVEIDLGHGTRVTFSAQLTPEELAERIERMRAGIREQDDEEA